MKLENPTEPRGIILCDLVARPICKIGIRQLFWKTLHEKGYHVRSSMAFRGNDVANGIWHHIVFLERGHICHVRGPWDGKQGPRRGFPIRHTGDGIFIFGVTGRLFFVKQLRGAHFSIARDLRIVGGYVLRTTYHVPYARKKTSENPPGFLRCPAESAGN